MLSVLHVFLHVPLQTKCYHISASNAANHLMDWLVNKCTCYLKEFLRCVWQRTHQLFRWLTSATSRRMVIVNSLPWSSHQWNRNATRQCLCLLLVKMPLQLPLLSNNFLFCLVSYIKVRWLHRCSSYDIADNIIKDRLCIRFLLTLTLCVKWWDYCEHNMGSSRCDYDTFMNNRPNRLDMENSMVLAGYKSALKVWEFQSYNRIYCALSVHDSHRVRKSLDGI